MAGKLPCLPGALPTLNDWENHLRTLYPEVIKSLKFQICLIFVPIT
jgi:gamma-glutamylcysteine synthetase